MYVCRMYFYVHFLLSIDLFILIGDYVFNYIILWHLHVLENLQLVGFMFSVFMFVSYLAKKN